MTESTRNQASPDGEAQTTPATEPKTAYRWRYADQIAHDADLVRRQKRRSLLIYSLALGSAFLVSFAILIVVLLLTGSAAA